MLVFFFVLSNTASIHLLPVHYFCWNRQTCLPQTPDITVSAPDVSGSLPGVSGEASVPSVGGGVDVDVAVPSVCLLYTSPSPRD